jgi:hypothetical protein
VLRFALISAIILVLTPVAVSTASFVNQESVVYSCPMHPEVQSSTPGKCPKCEMTLVAPTRDKAKKAVEQRATENPADTYTCPMHLEIRTNAPGKCPKCQMTLVPANPGVPEDFDLRMEATPKAPRVNEKVRLRFAIYNPKTGQQVKQFAILHDKLFHLFVVSQDMTEFQHIHPELEPDGSFTIETSLPRPGQYKVFSDFYPIDGIPQVLQRNLATAGASSDLFSTQARLTPDQVLTKKVDGLNIDLKLEPAQIIAGRPATLKYHLTDARTGEPIKDLAPYLGALGHTLILSEDQSDYVHSHPEELVPESTDKEKVRGGPDVTFGALLPRPGVYRIWTQFLRGETLTTVSFTVKAARLY